MISTVSRPTLVLVLLASMSVVLMAKSDEELAEIGMRAAARSAAQFDREEGKRAFREELAGLPDGEIIRALAHTLFELDKDPKWNMRADLGAGMSYALGRDRELIEDYSELKLMLDNEQDPRRLFLLASLIPWWSTDEKQYDFVPQWANMLFRDGPVAKMPRESTRPYHDVSRLAYEMIMAYLKHADFEPPEGVPHDEQAVILGRWLKEHWPGCEDLQLPESGRIRNSLGASEVRTRRPPPKGRHEEAGLKASTEARDEPSSVLWFFVGGLILLSALTLVLLRTLRARQVA